VLVECTAQVVTVDIGQTRLSIALRIITVQSVQTFCKPWQSKVMLKAFNMFLGHSEIFR